MWNMMNISLHRSVVRLLRQNFKCISYKTQKLPLSSIVGILVLKLLRLRFLRWPRLGWHPRPVLQDITTNGSKNELVKLQRCRLFRGQTSTCRTRQDQLSEINFFTFDDEISLLDSLCKSVWFYSFLLTLISWSTERNRRRHGNVDVKCKQMQGHVGVWVNNLRVCVCVDMNILLDQRAFDFASFRDCYISCKKFFTNMENHVEELDNCRFFSNRNFSMLVTRKNSKNACVVLNVSYGKTQKNFLRK